MDKQKVEIRGAFSVDEFRDILAGLIYEGFDLTVVFSSREWIIKGEKERPMQNIAPLLMPIGIDDLKTNG